jgi:hypothetical protein
MFSLLPSPPEDGGKTRPDKGHLCNKLHSFIIPFFLLPFIVVCRDSVVDTTTVYGLDGLRIETGVCEVFLHVQTSLGAHPASYTMGTVSFSRVKQSERGFDHQPPSRAEVKERVEIYLYSHSGPSWPVVG